MNSKHQGNAHYCLSSPILEQVPRTGSLPGCWGTQVLSLHLTMASALPTELSPPAPKVSLHLFKVLYFTLSMHALPKCMCLYHMRSHARGRQKMVLDPLELEIRVMVVNCPEDAGNQILVFCKGSQCSQPPCMPPIPVVTLNFHHLWLLFCRVSFS